MLTSSLKITRQTIVVMVFFSSLLVTEVESQSTGAVSSENSLVVATPVSLTGNCYFYHFLSVNICNLI